jgi:hypothetical protein
VGNMVACVDCGKVLLSDNAFTRVRIGAFVGYTATEWLCDGCRFPAPPAGYMRGSPFQPVQDFPEDSSAREREDDEDGIYEGEW